MQRKYIALLILFGVLVLLVGCQVNSGQSTNSTLIYGGVTEPANLNPLFGNDSACNEVQSLIFDTLVKVNNKMEIVPSLAENWQVKDQGKEYILHLRSGVKWQDGQPFGPLDVKFTFNKILDAQVASGLAGEFQQIRNVSLTENGIVFRLKQPDAAFLTRLAQVYILPQHLLSKESNLRRAAFNSKPIGTGPYRLVELKRTQYLKFVAYNGYYRGAPSIKELYYKIVPASQALNLQLQKGEIDVAQLDSSSYDQLRGSQNIKLLSLPGQAYTFIALNNRLALFSDSRVRQALAIGHNREKVIKNIFAGHAYLAKGDLPPRSWGYDAQLAPLSYNPQKAAQLLAQAGWQKNKDGILSKGGAKFTFNLLIASSNEKNKEIALAFQQDMKDLGIKVKIISMEFNVLRQKYLLPHSFQACLMSQRLGPDPDSRFLSWYSKGAYNFSGLNNPTIDGLFLQGRWTIQQEKREAIYQEIQKILVEEQPVIFYSYPQLLLGVRKGISGISQEGIGAKDNPFWNITQWKKE